MLAQNAFLPAELLARPALELADWRHDTLVDLLHRRAAAQPDLVLYTFLDDGESQERSITAAELDRSARGIGRTLAKLGPAGTRVILLFEDGLDTIAGLFGCLSAGFVAVSGIHPDAPRSTERLLGIVRDCRASIVLGQARVLAEFQRALDDVLDELDLRWVASDMIKPSAAEGWSAQAHANQSLALIQYTSGSTRAPRGVMLTHRNILHNLRSQGQAFGYPPGSTGVSWLPFSHDMGLIGCVLMAVYGGGRCVLLSPSHFLEDPLRWLRAISKHRATMSGGPTFAFDLCARRADPAALAALDLSCWTVAVSGAEPVRADVMRRFAEVFQPAGFRAEALRPSYGLAEATLLVTCGKPLAPLTTRILDKTGLCRNLVVALDPGAPPSQGTELVGCGAALADQPVAIVDPQTLAPLGSGAIGEIWVAGPSISAGYFERPDDNAAYFAGDLNDGRGPYLRTGDLGFELDGELFITGRLRDLIVVRGKNYYPQDIEHSAETSHAALRPGGSACFLMDEAADLVVVAELLRGQEENAVGASAAIREAIIRDHGVNPRRVVLAAWGSVQKTPSGKVQRAQTRLVYTEARMAVVHESVAAEQSASAKRPVAVDMARVEEWFLAKMAAMGFDVATLDPAMRLTELGFDSLKIVELKTELERDLGIVVPIADLYAFQDIQSLAQHLRREAHRKRDVAPTPGGRTPSRLAEQRLRRGAAAATAGGPSSL